MHIETKTGNAWLNKRVEPGVFNGPYELVAYEVQLKTNKSQLVWFCPETGSVIHEACEGNRPYKGFMLDWDGTLVDTESPEGLFAVSWRELYRSSGIQGSDDDLDALKRKIYRWNRTLKVSVEDMLSRVGRGIDIYNNVLDDDMLRQAHKLLEPETHIRWAKENGRDYGQVPLKDPAAIIADKKEFIGKSLLEQDPARVKEVAPFIDGAMSFIHLIPGHMPLVIVSGSRVETTIRPILGAYEKLGIGLGRDILLIGEDTIIPTEAAKPDGFYYQIAAAMAWRHLHLEHKVITSPEPQDLIFIGDTIAHSVIYDMPGDRIMHHIVLGADESERLGPLASGAKDFRSLLHTLNRPMSEIDNFTLQRLALTLG